MNVLTAQVDANKVDELVRLFEDFKPELVVNLALPYQDLHIMDACLKYGVSYLDTANYEPLDEAKYEYSWQWAYKDRFEKAGLTAILGCGFDPGVTGVFTAYAAKHHFDELHYLDIVDCNTDLKNRMCMMDDMREVIGDALAFDGKSVNSLNDADLAQAERLIVDTWKPNLVKFDASVDRKSVV